MDALLSELQGVEVGRREPGRGKLAGPLQVEIGIGGIERDELQEQFCKVDPGSGGGERLSASHVKTFEP